MKNITRLSFVVLLSLSMSLFLIQCGGSGEGGGIEYDGMTTQTQIDAGNAETVAMNAYENSTSMRTMGETGGIFGAVSVNDNGQMTKSYGVTLAQFVRDFLVQADSSAESGNPVMAAVSGSESMEGECGGKATISGTVNEETGSFNITAKFSSYCSNGDGSTGTVTVNGTMKMNGSFQSNSLQANLTFSNITITQSDTGVSETASGTMYMAMDLSSGSALIRMTMVVRDESADKTYKVEDLEIDMDVTLNSATLHMEGRFYNPDYGYVDITTTGNFVLDVSDNTPTSGTIVITGASSTKARFIVVSRTQYQVEADTDGNGYVDVTGIKSW